MQSALLLLFQQGNAEPHRSVPSAPLHHGSQQFPTCCGCKGRMCQPGPQTAPSHCPITSRKRSLWNCLKSE